MTIVYIIIGVLWAAIGMGLVYAAIKWIQEDCDGS